MTFFDDDEPLPAEFAPPTPRRRRWRGEPDDSLGVPVGFADFLVRTDDVALIVSGIVAFPAGFSFSLICLSRLDPAPERLGPLGPRPWRRGDDDGMRFGIGFADASRVTDRGPRGEVNDGSERSLHPRGGGGGGRRFAQGYFCRPLPPPGPMRFVCRWPAHSIEETSLELDAALILEAAARSRPIWPDDVDLADDDDGPPHRGGTWSSYSPSTASATLGAASSPRRRRGPPRSP